MEERIYTIENGIKVFRCIICHNELTEENKSDLIGSCKECEEKTKLIRENRALEQWLRSIYNTIQNGANARKHPFNIRFTKFMYWYLTQEKVCSYCGCTYKEMREFDPTYKRFSIDRIDNSIGYQMDNICLCCTHCNNIKGDRFTASQMKELGVHLHKIYTT